MFDKKTITGSLEDIEQLVKRISFALNECRSILTVVIHTKETK